MSTPIPITPECLPGTPCWLWQTRAESHQHNPRWVKSKEREWSYRDLVWCGFTHWSPDAPNAPIERPDDEPDYHGGKVHKEMEAQTNAEQETLGGDDNALVQTSVQPGGIEPPVIPSDPASRATPNNEALPSEAGMVTAIHEALGNTPFHVTVWEREAQTKAVMEVIDRAFDAERRAHEQDLQQLVEKHVAVWNALRRADASLRWLAASEHKECSEDLERVAEALRITPRQSGDYRLFLATEIEQLRARLAALERERDGLRTDGERLDWLEKNRSSGVGADGPSIRIVGITATPESNWKGGQWSGPTVRAAIDAARKENSK